MELPIDSLSVDNIEHIERTSLRSLFLATRDFANDAWEFFRQSQDDPKDIAEDITRELLDRLGGYTVSQRIFGNVDYRKARYIILPDFAIRQAFMVDSKAEKNNSSATLQMSQVSLTVRQQRSGAITDIPGNLPSVAQYNDSSYLTTVLLSHYHYNAQVGNDGKDRPPYALNGLTLVAVPNGKLQDIYNPDHEDTIFIAGRNAPSRDEPFRVRLSFSRLESKARWRVQRFTFTDQGDAQGDWCD
jgi:hypothetical protein